MIFKEKNPFQRRDFIRSLATGAFFMSGSGLFASDISQNKNPVQGEKITDLVKQARQLCSAI